jgi:hypothetical protein
VRAVFVSLIDAGGEDESDAPFDFVRVASVIKNGDNFALQFWPNLIAFNAAILYYKVDYERRRNGDECAERDQPACGYYFYSNHQINGSP